MKISVDFVFKGVVAARVLSDTKNGVSETENASKERHGKE